MVLDGRAPDDDNPGRDLFKRISWSVVDGDPDRVRQHWQTSPDGVEWQTAFDDYYVRAG